MFHYSLVFLPYFREIYVLENLEGHHFIKQLVELVEFFPLLFVHGINHHFGITLTG